MCLIVFMVLKVKLIFFLRNFLWIFLNRHSIMHVQAYVCICMYMYAYTSTCVFECVCVHVYICMCGYVFVCTLCILYVQY